MCKIVRELEEIILLLIVHNIHTEMNCKGEESLQNKARDNNYSSWEIDAVHNYNTHLTLLILYLCRYYSLP